MLGLEQVLAEEGTCWSPLGSCVDWPGFGAPFWAGKGDVLDQGARSQEGESVGTFLCQRRAEKEGAIRGLDALI